MPKTMSSVTCAAVLHSSMCVRYAALRIGFSRPDPPTGTIPPVTQPHTYPRIQPPSTHQIATTHSLAARYTHMESNGEGIGDSLDYVYYILVSENQEAKKCGLRFITFK